MKVVRSYHRLRCPTKGKTPIIHRPSFTKDIGFGLEVG